MNLKKNIHTFHIPVLGTAYSIDTPAKVAHLGISSVISLADDYLVEKMREFYSSMLNIPFQPISRKTHDHRAIRITSYLNMIDKIVKEKFEELKNTLSEKNSELQKYMEMLPDFSELKKDFFESLNNNNFLKDVKKWLSENISPGAIDVNIMTKLDTANYKFGEPLPVEFNNAHAALRGFANSNLQSSVVLSAGMNPRLYSYFEEFKDFYPDENGKLNKKIILKVSDYRSALIQGKFLAKKGLWISEFRVESGLNCGGHAFATQGNLLGPILEEFKHNRESLRNIIFEEYAIALKDKNLFCPQTPPEIKLTAQGGVGTSDEHNFLLEHYQLDSVGWGTPFLLVPEVVNIDENTIELLEKAHENDLYLSGISPLGVPFNSVKNNSQDINKEQLIENGTPGSVCPRKYLNFFTEFNSHGECSASRTYQKAKIAELDSRNLPKLEYKKLWDKIVEKACICVGLGAPITNKDDHKIAGTSVCPGPNIAYFDKRMNLKTMIDHIYGRINVISRTDRPNLFLKELRLYIDYLTTKIEDTPKPTTIKDKKYLEGFQTNLLEGIEYYKNLFTEFKGKVQDFKEEAVTELKTLENKVKELF